MSVEGVGFYEIAQNHPDRPALPTPGRPVTYGELHAEVNRLSNALGGLGLRPGDSLATVLGNRPEFLTVLLAAFQSGLYLVPVSRHLTASEIGYILADSGAKAVVTESAFGDVVKGAADEAGIPAEGRVSVDPAEGYGSMAELCAKGGADPPGKRQMGSVMLYTSGTTGRPKGVRRSLLDIPPEMVLDLMRQTLSMLALPDEVRARYDLSSLRQVYHSAAPIPVETKHRMLDWWGPVLYEYYGSTESGPVVVATPEQWLARPGTVGRAVDGVQIKILDPEGAELPPGETGLIYASGQPGFEYHDDPEKTASAMRGDFYTPGDLGHLDEDGWLYMSDRRTDLIISGGVNIYPAEIENALLQHPAVADVAVIGVPDDDWGQSVVALVEPAADAAAGDALAAGLLAHCEPRLSKLKHPRRIEFRESLPRTPSGKLSRRRVREDYLEERAG
ncbi:acyl-CoA synthetase [Actinomadura sp. KC345]|uniref:AMP-binding protein n=1 Tax=Actinomadura sp. KC345 TaxID=2530371 RepID=UPI00104504AD|nr:AMP-binding protein [Actinomadura sp. KC345]TDC47241.1 acyl-CoA synthetase [Actinomadura sp. KC345]